MKKANENNFLATVSEELEEKRLFIINFGWLLSQTRKGINHCEMSDDGTKLIIIYNNGNRKEININLDSYVAIIRDTLKYL